MIKSHKNVKVKDAVRVHSRPLTFSCLVQRNKDYDLDYPGRPDDLKGNWVKTFENYERIKQGLNKAIDDGHFVAETHCKYPGHITFKTPKSELDIPLGYKLQTLFS